MNADPRVAFALAAAAIAARIDPARAPRIDTGHAWRDPRARTTAHPPVTVEPAAAIAARIDPARAARIDAGHAGREPCAHLDAGRAGREPRAHLDAGRA